MFEIDFDIIFLIIVLLFILYLTININKTVIYDDPLIFKLKDDLIQVDERVRLINFYASNESFTEDKKKIYICLRDRFNNYYDYNTLVYVTCHELAHAFSSTFDKSHSSEEFRKNFEELLTKAEKLKLFDPTKPIEPHYCKF